MTVAEAYETAIGMLRDLPDYEKTSTQEFAEQFLACLVMRCGEGLRGKNPRVWRWCGERRAGCG